MHGLITPPLPLPPPLAASLQGTWVGSCLQFAATNTATGEGMCAPYKAGALRYNLTSVYAGNSYRYSAGSTSSSYNGVRYSIPQDSVT